MIYGFAFNNDSRRLLLNLKNIDKSFFLRNKEDIDILVNDITDNNPRYVLGIGLYSGKDNERIRIESKCTNKFRNKTVDAEFKEVRINFFVKETQRSKIVSGIGNSYCNLVSWRIMEKITNKDIGSKYTFLHLPKGWDIKEAQKEIEMMMH